MDSFGEWTKPPPTPPPPTQNISGMVVMEIHLPWSDLCTLSSLVTMALSNEICILEYVFQMDNSFKFPKSKMYGRIQAVYALPPSPMHLHTYKGNHR